MNTRNIGATDLRWESLAPWILEWEGVDNPEPTLSEWNAELAATATCIDARVSWDPTCNTVTAPVDVDMPHIEHTLRSAVRKLVHG
ncbi:hypothetical protein R1X32_09090 (plasmid) [Rhodococcus opacus]|uniref:hypothetical protein n=1 Tax=Rhodococcus opacus TaxID=37919 RepID=UPI0002A2AF49|nr:hypothetical protein [Rhodococcus opacus]ELB88314.1 hypothetical protein Rwratislav_35304 [Rhodococcus wratislaviensis IFP 2016]MDV6248076.1 hypothetical protein [Rhodococcus opacus]WKN59884.1 hypothetical protein HJ581_0039210 [Rhodococcus opacus]